MTVAELKDNALPTSENPVGGKYRLLQQIGKGGMAKVWCGEHVTLGRTVAVKFVDLVGGTAEEVAERFMREARAAASIRHKNVVDIIDFGTTQDNIPYMVMELLEGETLADLFRRDPTPDVDLLVEIACQTLSALSSVHAAGIVHRDLKPENIFIVDDTEGVFVKLLDFGISHNTQPDTESVLTTQGNVVVGTPEYVAPEQARGKDVDLSADLYGIGVILYEGITGDPPYHDDDVNELLLKVVRGGARPIEMYRPDLAALSEVIEKAMSLREEDRYGSARHMRSALLKSRGRTTGLTMMPAELVDKKDSGVREIAPTLGEGEISAPSEFAVVEVEEFEAIPPKSRTLWVVLGALLLAALCTGGYIWYENNEVAEQRKLEAERIEQAERDRVEDATLEEARVAREAARKATQAAEQARVEAQRLVKNAKSENQAIQKKLSAAQAAAAEVEAEAERRRQMRRSRGSSMAMTEEPKAVAEPNPEKAPEPVVETPKPPKPTGPIIRDLDF